MAATTTADAGAYGAWLAALRRGADADVPCDGCTACCRAGYFIHVEPDEHAALAAIPEALLFPAPGLPPDHRVLGHDTNGHCPMLVDGACSIYANRPRTCRRFDCRVFAATRSRPTETPAAAVAERVVQWQFRHEDTAARVDHEAATRSARFLDQHAQRLPRGAVPVNTTQRALLAVRLYALFLPGAPGHRAAQPDADAAAIDAALAAIAERLEISGR